MAAQKVDGTCTFVARGYRISFVSRCLWVSQDVRIAGRIADENVKRMIQMLCYAYMPSAMSHPHSNKYILALLRCQSEVEGLAAVNAKRVLAHDAINSLLLEGSRRHSFNTNTYRKVVVGASNQPWCSNRVELRCYDGEKRPETFALDCCDRDALHCSQCWWA